MRKSYTIQWLITGLVAVFLFALIGIHIYDTKPPIIPGTIQKQVNFPIFYPNLSQRVDIETNSFKYDKSLGQVTFIVKFASRSITFAEQTSPDSFAADPTFYNNFIEKLGGYATFDSVNGTVSLTEPAQVDAQTAVMNAKGTLLFAKSSGNISQNNWTLLFNSLAYTQP